MASAFALRFVPIIPLCLLAAGCRSSQPSAPLATATPFDAKEASFIKTKGETKVSGHAFWRSSDGGTQNAAGEIVRLVPATAYSRERFGTLYGGKHSINAGEVPHTDPDAAYADYTRTTRAESNGRFEFENVAAGTYFVTTQVTWKDKHKFAQQGGSMYDTLTVTGKEDDAIKLVLTNDK
jgi:hypothetical protein